MYSSYKLAKKTYRKVCNMAVNIKIYSEFNTISNLHLCKRSGKNVEFNPNTEAWKK